MKVETKIFLRKTVILALVLAVLGATIIHSLLPHVPFAMFMAQLAVVFTGTLISHIQLRRAFSLNVVRFNMIFMTVSMIRMLVYALLITVYLLVVKEYVFEFVASFIIIYFSYLVLDISEFTKISNTQNRPFKKVKAQRR